MGTKDDLFMCTWFSVLNCRPSLALRCRLRHHAKYAKMSRTIQRSHKRRKTLRN